MTIVRNQIHCFVQENDAVVTVIENDCHATTFQCRCAQERFAHAHHVKGDLSQISSATVCRHVPEHHFVSMQGVAVNWIIFELLLWVSRSLLWSCRWWAAGAVLDILDGHWEGLRTIRQSLKKNTFCGSQDTSFIKNIFQQLHVKITPRNYSARVRRVTKSQLDIEKYHSHCNTL